MQGPTHGASPPGRGEEPRLGVRAGGLRQEEVLSIRCAEYSRQIITGERMSTFDLRQENSCGHCVGTIRIQVSITLGHYYCTMRYHYRAELFSRYHLRAV